ncbi:MAG: SpoIID/LytB domain-containing protein [Actinomycetota bacterium]
MPTTSPRSRLRGGAMPLVLVLVATAAAVVPVPGRAASAYPTANVEIDGHGWGHGRGMGQYGALGYALNHGRDYRQILAHYYSNTVVGEVPAGSEMTVILRSFDRQDTLVAQERGQMTTNAAGGTFSALRAVMIGPNRFRVDSGPTCAGPWTQVQADMAGPVVMAPVNRNDDRQDMLQACEPNGNRRWYRGEIRAVEGLDGTSRTINATDLQSYLRGVVPRESPASWGDLGGGAGMHALRAQTVAARSYAMAGNLAHYAKTCDTTECQVYGGRAVQSGPNFFDLEDPRSNRAIDETAGEVRFLNGVPARTEYSSSTGGYTAGGTFPAVVDEGDSVSLNPNHNWRASVPVGQVEAAFPQVGTLNNIVVTRRNGLGDFGGRAIDVEVQGSASTARISGEAFQWALGLRSNWYRISGTTVPAPTTTPTTSGTTPTTLPVPSGGYWVAGADGQVYAFGGAPFLGSMGGTPLLRPVVGVAATVTAGGYWLVASDGGLFTFGDAKFLGSMGGAPLNQPMVAIAPTPSGNGYWTVATDGGIFTFGDAPFKGSMGATPLVRPMVGMAGTSSGQGYWTVASDGGIFTFGDAPFLGSMGGAPLREPVVGMAPSPSGNGYWLVASDGGIFTFGDAQFKGSTGAMTLARPIVGMAPTPSGNGYWLVASDGGIFTFGDAQFFGSVPGVAPSPTAKVGMATATAR